MLNLLDGDIIAYRAAASCEPTKAKPFLEPCEVAMWRLHDIIQTIIKGTNCNDIECYIGGENNFRKKLYPLYKANRTKPAPTWLQDCREILVTQYAAIVVNDYETDDALGIAQTKYDGNSRIVSLDKDLLQISGHHFQWEISGVSTTGKKWIKPATHYLVSPLDGLRTFYKQLIAGDGTDNIPSYDGKVRNSIPKFIEKLQAPLDEMTDELDMYNYVVDIYHDNIELQLTRFELAKRNAQLLYILKEEGKYWQPPNGTTQESETS